ncbi:Protein FAM221A [Plasmodiophora brassicae]|uniref:Protein FAM221A n=1 Tax=Plasmodiophora brassicae TaxID=37360 RepID=A0A0G4J2H0_PLABS|nr:hypothetical protein PBRA_002171 [Plasmodiophora brassicae]SPQ93165.1 unnamed protein product [Plasmodiophora brassicae]
MSSERIVVSGSLGAHVDAYWEYRMIVGDADGGVLFTPEQYEAFKEKRLREPRLYVSWRPIGTTFECRLIGPESKCFCTHRYKSHSHESPSSTKCLVPKCICTAFDYIPVRGAQDLKCHCKHSYREHTAQERACARTRCSCQRFTSSFGCSCGRTFVDHETIIQTGEERTAEGLPTGDGPASSILGGITSMESLVDGVERMAISADQAVRPRTIAPRRAPRGQHLRAPSTHKAPNLPGSQ